MTLLTYLIDAANVVSFLVSILSIFSLLHYHFTEDIYFVMMNIYIVFAQLACDIFLWHTNASVIHHLCALLLIYSFFSIHSDLDVREYIYILLPILSTEISTLFLVIKYWMEQLDLKNTFWYKVNLLVFFVVFVITRIFIYTAFVILNPKTYELDLSKYVYLSLYGLFGLNIYWVTIMIKVMLKPLKQVLTNVYTEMFIKYGQIVNVVIVFWFERDLTINLLGSSLVAVSSFLSYELILSNSMIGNSFFLFLMHVTFQIKSILFVFGYIGIFFGHISILYHFFFFTFTLFILIQHNSQFYFDGKTIVGIMIGFFCFEYYTDFYLLSNNIFVLILTFPLIFYTYPIFYLTEIETMLIPVILDASAVIYYIPSIEMKIYFGVISYLMVVAIYVKPMYNHNLVLLYVLSFLQTYVLYIN